MLLRGRIMVHWSLSGRKGCMLVHYSGETGVEEGVEYWWIGLVWRIEMGRRKREEEKGKRKRDGKGGSE